ESRRPRGGGHRQPGDGRAREVRRTAVGQGYDLTMQIEERSAFATIEEAIEDIRQGKFVVVVDAADRENEGDLTIAAQFATPEAVNFMTKEARGLICFSL